VAWRETVIFYPTKKQSSQSFFLCVPRGLAGKQSFFIPQSPQSFSLCVPGDLVENNHFLSHKVSRQERLCFENNNFKEKSPCSKTLLCSEYKIHHKVWFWLQVEF